MLIGNILKEYEYSVIEAADGEKALLRFQEHSDTIRLVFLDVVMPKKNGKEVYAEIREIRQDVQVLFETYSWSLRIIIDSPVWQAFCNGYDKSSVPRANRRSGRAVDNQQ